VSRHHSSAFSSHFFVNVDEEDFFDDGAALDFREAHPSLRKKRTVSHPVPDNNDGDDDDDDDEDDDAETSSDRPRNKLVCEASCCIKYVASNRPFPNHAFPIHISEPDFLSGSKFRRPTSASVHVLTAVREVHVGDPINFMNLENGGVYISIASSNLVHALEVVNGWTTNTIDSGSMSQIMKIQEPYKPVVDHLDELRNYGQTYGLETDLDTTMKHIDVLLRYIDKAIGNELREEMRLKEATPPLVTFNWLWTIFRNGVTLYSASTDQAYELDSISGGPLGQTLAVPRSVDDERLKRVSLPFYTVTASYLDVEGPLCFWRTETFQIERFIGTIAVESLSVFPLHHARDAGTELHQRLLERGKKMKRLLLAAPCHQEYDAWSLDPHARKVVKNSLLFS
jgi:hypothetical protein